MYVTDGEWLVPGGVGEPIWFIVAIADWQGGTGDLGEGRPRRDLYSVPKTLDFIPKVIGNN